MTVVTLLLKPAVLPLNLFDKAFHLEIICSEKMFEFSLFSQLEHCTMQVSYNTSKYRSLVYEVEFLGHPKALLLSI